MNKMLMSLLFIFLLSLAACSSNAPHVTHYNSPTPSAATAIEKASSATDNAQWVLVDGAIIGIEVNGHFYQMPELDHDVSDSHYF